MISLKELEDSPEYKKLESKDEQRKAIGNWSIYAQSYLRSAEERGDLEEGELERFQSGIKDRFNQFDELDVLSVEGAKEVGEAITTSVGGMAMGAALDVKDVAQTKLAIMGEATGLFEVEKSDEMKIRERSLEMFARKAGRFFTKDKDQVESRVDKGLEILVSNDFNNLDTEGKDKVLTSLQDELHKITGEFNDELPARYKNSDSHLLSSDENKLNVLQFRLTRDPKYLQNIKNNLTQSLDDKKDQEYIDFLRKDSDVIINKLPEGKAKEMVKNMKSLALSPGEKMTDILATLTSAGLGKVAGAVLKVGKNGRIARVGTALTANAAEEAGAEALMALIDNPFMSETEFWNTVKLGAATGIGMQAGVQGVAEIKGDFKEVSPKISEEEMTEQGFSEEKKSAIRGISGIEEETGEIIEVYETLDEMPDGRAKTMATGVQSGGNNVEAFINPETGSVVYNVQGIKNKAAADGVSFDDRIKQLNNHEIVVHKGVKRLYSEESEFNDFHQDIYDTFKDDIDTNIAPNYNEFDVETTEGQIGLAHEWLAQFGETVDLEDSLWSTVVDKFKNFINTGDKTIQDLKKEELRDVLKTTYKNMKTPKARQRSENFKEEEDGKQEADSQEEMEAIPSEDASKEGQVPDGAKGVSAGQKVDAKKDVPQIETDKEFMDTSDGDGMSKLIQRGRESENPTINEASNRVSGSYKRKSLQQTVMESDGLFSGYMARNSNKESDAISEAIRDLERPEVLSQYGREGLDAIAGLGSSLLERLDILINESTNNLDINSYKAQSRRLTKRMKELARESGRFVNALKLFGGNKVQTIIKDAITSTRDELLKNTVDRQFMDDTAQAMAESSEKGLMNTLSALEDAGKRLDERNKSRKEESKAKKKADKEASVFTFRQAVKELGGVKIPDDKAGGEYDGFFTGDLNKDGSKKKKNFGPKVARKDGRDVDTLIQAEEFDVPESQGDLEEGVNPFEDDELTPFSKQKLISDGYNQSAFHGSLKSDIRRFKSRSSKDLKSKPDHDDFIMFSDDREYSEKWVSEISPEGEVGDLSKGARVYEVQLKGDIIEITSEDFNSMLDNYFDLENLLEDDRLTQSPLYKITGMDKGLFGKEEGWTVYATLNPDNIGIVEPSKKTQDLLAENLSFSKQKLDKIDKAAEKLVSEYSNITGKDGKKDPVISALLSNVRKAMNEQLPKKKVDKIPDTELMATALKNYSKYEELWNKFHEGILEKFQDDPDKVAQYDEIFDNISDDLFSEKIFRGVAKESIKEIIGGLRELVQKVKENTDTELRVRHIVSLYAIDKMGLSESEAVIFSNRFNDVFSKMAREEREKARKQIVDKYESKKNRSDILKKNITLLDRLIRNDNLNVFKHQDAYEAVAESLGLPSFSPEVSAKIQEFMDKLQGFPPDSIQQQEVLHQIQQYIADTVGIETTELVQGIYVTAMLSGWSTQLVNIVGGLSNLLGSNIAAMTSEVIQSKNPTHYLDLLGAMFKGMSQGFMSGKSKAKLLWDTGYASDIQTSQKFVIPTAMEVARFGDSVKFKNETIVTRMLSKLFSSKIGWLFKANQSIARSMQMADLVIRDMGRLSKSYVMATGIAKRTGKSFSEASATANDILYRTPKNLMDAKKQAINEGATGAMINVRAEQIIMDKVDEDIVQSSETFAGRASYNEPYRQTLMGGLARGLDSLFNTWIDQNPIAGRTAKLISFPFIRIVANVTDRVIDFTPLGFGRDMARANKEADYIGSADRSQQISEAIVGTTAMAMIYGLSQVKLGEDEEGNPIYALELHGSGPKNPQDRYLWQQAGNQPFSMRIAGSPPIVFKDTPFALAMGTVANIQEAIKDGNTTEDAVGNVLMKTFSLWSSQSFLSGVENIAGILSSSDSMDTKVKRFKRMFSGVPAKLTVPAQNFFLQTDKELFPTTVENKNLMDAMVREFPFVRHSVKPMLNSFGDPVKSAPSERFIKMRVEPDPFAKLLSDNGLQLRTTNKRTWKVRIGSELKAVDMTEDEFYEFHKEASRIYMKQIRKVVPKLIKRKVDPSIIQGIIRESTDNARDRVYNTMNRKKRTELLRK
jgi:hypothetical protein